MASSLVSRQVVCEILLPRLSWPRRVTVPSGLRVLPGVNVTTNAEAADPALGKVVPVTQAELAALVQELSNSKALARGYVTLYQGNSATGPSPGIPDSVTGIFNGFLPNVQGSSPEPGSPTVAFEPPHAPTPQYRAPNGRFAGGLYPQLRARVIGQVLFDGRSAPVWPLPQGDYKAFFLCCDGYAILDGPIAFTIAP